MLKLKDLDVYQLLLDILNKHLLVSYTLFICINILNKN